MEVMYERGDRSASILVSIASDDWDGEIAEQLANLIESRYSVIAQTGGSGGDFVYADDPDDRDELLEFLRVERERLETKQTAIQAMRENFLIYVSNLRAGYEPPA
jgi:hypothetical protein